MIVNNAASFRLKTVDEFTLEDFDDHVAVNVRAPYFLVQAALPALRSSPAAVVVNVSSAAAAMYRRGQTVYGLTKAALEHMTMNMAAELAPDRDPRRLRAAGTGRDRDPRAPSRDSRGEAAPSSGSSSRWGASASPRRSPAGSGISSTATPTG